jgi:hypothetical protein
MPFPQFHSARQKSPNQFQTNSFKTIKITDGVSAIIGKPIGKESTEVQTYRFDKDKFTVAQAKQWLKDNKASSSDFEPASEEVKASQFNTKFSSELIKAGKEWEIVLISSGNADTLTGKVFMSQAVLQASLDKFQKVDVYAHQFGTDFRTSTNHRPNGMENPNLFIVNKVGWVDNIRIDNEGTISKMSGTLHCVNPVIKEMLVNIWESDREHMPEFSIDANIDGVKVGDRIHIKAIKQVNSLDMVTKGAFKGTGFERMVASNKGENMNELIKQILAKVKAGDIKLNEDIANKSDEQITDMIKAALKSNEIDEKKIEEIVKAAITPQMLASLLGLQSIDEIKAGLNKIIEAEKKAATEPKEPMKASDPEPDPEPAPAEPAEPKKDDNEDRIAKLENELKLQASMNKVTELVSADKTLNDESKAKIKNQFVGRVATEEEVKAALIGEKEYLDKILATNKINNTPIIQVGSNSVDKMTMALEVFINPNAKDDNDKLIASQLAPGERFVTLLDAIEQFSGERRIHDIEQLKAASTSNFTTVFQDVMNKQIRKQYTIAMVEDRLSKLVEEIDVQTLDEQHIYDIGHFGLVDTVAEGADYTQLSNPADVEAKYTLTKKGNLFEITEEMLFTSGDKVTQLVRLFPKKMAVSAKATRNLFIANLITGCNGSTINAQTIYDGSVLYTSAHGNLVAGPNAALDYTTFYNGYTAMANQTVLSSPYPAEIEPKYLLVPHELMPTAVNVAKSPVYPSQTSNGVQIPNPYSGLGVEPIAVPKYYLCDDANNWYLIGNKNTHPTIQIGYFRGARAPQPEFQQVINLYNPLN